MHPQPPSHKEPHPPPPPPLTATSSKINNENEEFLEADQFDFDQLNAQNAHLQKVNSVNSSLSSSRLSLPAHSHTQQANEKSQKGSTKQRLFNFINRASSSSSSSKESSQQAQTSQQRRLSDFHRPTKVDFFVLVLF